MTTITYRLTSVLKKRLEAKNMVFVCCYCGTPILPGQKVVSKYLRNGKRRYYHASCYKRLFV